MGARVPAIALVEGAVVWARVPFADRSGEKVRPAVVLDVVDRVVTVVPLHSSAGARRTFGAVTLRRWTDAGLDRPAVAMLRTVEIDLDEVLGLMGHLHDDDFRLVA